MKIFLDAGHGGHDPGAVFKDYKEKDIALSLTLRIGARLISIGHEVAYSRVDDSYVSLTGRCSMANRWHADAFVSIHLNADPDEDAPGMYEAKGQEIWIYPAAADSRRLAECIAEELKVRFRDEPFRGIKEADLAVVTMTTMPAVLIESAFIDNETSIARLHQAPTQNLFAAAVTTGICKWAGD